MGDRRLPPATFHAGATVSLNAGPLLVQMPLVDAQIHGSSADFAILIPGRIDA